MAELIIACRDSVRRAVCAQVLAAWLALAGIGLAQAAAPEPSASTPSAPSVAPTFSVAALCSRGCAASRSSGYFNSPSSRPLLTTDNAARRVRMALYPAPGLLAALGVELRVAPASVLPDAHRLLLAVTGSERVSLDPTPDWVPGGLGDHLTSFGGDLQGAHGQSTALDWTVSGATANHGAVSEPCNHAQKFPHPQVLLLHYLQGSTATPKPCSGP